MPKGKSGTWPDERQGAPSESDVAADHVVEGENPSPDSNLKSEVAHIKRLKPFRNQVRRHTPRNIAMIGDSLQTVGFARSIVIDENDEILAGAGTVEAAGERGIENLRIIDIDGTEVVALRRTGLGEDEKTKLALFDNRTSDLGEYDVDRLKVVLSSLEQQGVTPKMFFDATELRMLEDREVANDMRNQSNGGGGNKESVPSIPKGYKAFSLVVSDAAEAEIREVLEGIKTTHALNTIAEALLVVVRAFKNSRQ